MSEEEYENSPVSTKEFIYNFSENFAMIDTEVMCSRPTDEDNHGPMFISLRPASFSSGDRRQYRMGATLHEAKLRKKEKQKENKRKEGRQLLIKQLHRLQRHNSWAKAKI